MCMLWGFGLIKYFRIVFFVRLFVFRIVVFLLWLRIEHITALKKYKKKTKQKKCSRIAGPAKEESQDGT